MANNVSAANNGSPVIFSTDEIQGTHIPQFKLLLGDEGLNQGAVSDANPLPVSDLVLAETVHTEDVAHVSGDKGIMMLAIRSDSDSATSDNGDYTALKMDEVGRLKVSTQPSSYVDCQGNITAINQTVVLNVDRSSNVTISMVATSLVGHNASFQYSNNSTNGVDGNWYNVQVVRTNANTVETSTGVLTGTPAYGWEVSVNAYKWFRVLGAAHTSGTAAYNIKQGTYATEPVPAIQVTGTQPVSGTVAISGTAAITLPTPTALNFNSAATTNLTSVKASAGTLYNVIAHNVSASARYLKLYNKASAPVVATDVPVLIVTLPANSTNNQLDFGILGHRFTTGIAMAVTGAIGDTDATAIAANDVRALISFV